MTSDLDLISFNGEFNNALKKQPVFGDANNNSSTTSNDGATDNGNNNAVVKNLAPAEEALLVQISGEDCNDHRAINGTNSEKSVTNENDLLFTSVNDNCNGDSEKPSQSLQGLSFPSPANSFTTVEETEVLETDSITESVEIMISPGKCSSELISIVSEESFESDFTLVADVKVENGDLSENEIRNDILENKGGIICEENHLPLLPEIAKQKLDGDQKKSPVVEQRKESKDNKLNSDRKSHSSNKKMEQPRNDVSAQSYPAAKIQIPRNEKAEKVATAESKIAMEIREMREREEELRIIREAALKELNGDCSSEKSSPRVQIKSCVKSSTLPSKLPKQATQTTVAKSSTLNGKAINGRQETVGNGNLDPLNLGLGQSYNVGCVFAHRRKGSVKVKPISDEETKGSNFKVLQESPVEREIRIAKEREEELKKEREQALLIKEQLEARNNHVDEIDSKAAICDNQNVDNELSEITKAPVDTVKKLATSRIQQEIEEQTQREKALKLSGSIKTLSVERADEKVNVLCINPPSSLNFLETSNWESEISPDSFTKSSSSGIFFNDKNDSDDSPLLLSSETSSNSSISRPIEPVSIRRFSNSPTSKNISMQRFIASKGKEIVFGNTVTKNSGVGCFDYHEIKPPQMRKGENIIKKRSVTAELKIQEELREMEAREAELRNQRNRYLGLSQPNLSLLDDQDDFLENNGTEQPSLERCSSNPNLLDDESMSDGMSEQNIPVGGPRKRSILIDQWEQRIQKAET